MRKALLTTLILTLSSSTIASGDWIKLNDGKVVHGEIILSSTFTLQIRVINDGEVQILKFKQSEVDEEEYEVGDQAVGEVKQEPTTPSNQNETGTQEPVQNTSTQVIVRGWGKDKDEALKDAWRNAIEIVAGTLITAKSTIENEKLFEDIVTSHSNGFVPDYDLLGFKIDEETGIVEVRINATVQSKVLFTRIDDAGTFAYRREVSAGNYYAAVVTQAARDKTAVSTLSEAMVGYPENIFDIKIGKDRPIRSGSYDDNLERVIIPISFSFNSKGWSNFVRNLNAYLKHVQDDSKKIKLRVPKEPASPRKQVNWADRKALDENVYFKHLMSNFGDQIYLADDLIKGVKSYLTFDKFSDVIVVLDGNLKNGMAYAVSSTIWESIANRFRQVPAFYLDGLDEGGNEIGDVLQGEFRYTPIEYVTNSYYDTFNISSLPLTNHEAHQWSRHSSSEDSADWVLEKFRFIDDPTVHPRVLYVSPFFHTYEEHCSAGKHENIVFFKYNGQGKRTLHKQFTRDYVITLTLEELSKFKEVVTDPYVIDLHNKSRRLYGEEVLDSGGG